MVLFKNINSMNVVKRQQVSHKRPQRIKSIKTQEEANNTSSSSDALIPKSSSSFHSDRKQFSLLTRNQQSQMNSEQTSQKDSSSDGVSESAPLINSNFMGLPGGWDNLTESSQAQTIELIELIQKEFLNDDLLLFVKNTQNKWLVICLKYTVDKYEIDFLSKVKNNIRATNVYITADGTIEFWFPTATLKASRQLQKRKYVHSMGSDERPNKIKILSY